MTAKIKFFLKFIVDKFLFFKTYEFIMNQENKYLSLISLYSNRVKYDIFDFWLISSLSFFIGQTNVNYFTNLIFMTILFLFNLSTDFYRQIKEKNVGK
jgi:hypothetical protein